MKKASQPSLPSGRDKVMQEQVLKTLQKIEEKI